jgi:hypothetical protein
MGSKRRIGKKETAVNLSSRALETTFICRTCVQWRPAQRGKADEGGNITQTLGGMPFIIVEDRKDVFSEIQPTLVCLRQV